MYFELFTGFRYLINRQKHTFISLITFLSVAGVAVGVMTLIVVIAVMTGAEYDLRSRILGSQPHVIVMHRLGLFSNWEKVAGRIQNISGVASVSPFIHKKIVLRSTSGMSGAFLKGIGPEFTPELRPELKSDKDLPADGNSRQKRFGKRETSDSPPIILGKSLAEELKVKKGDTLLYMLFSDEFGYGVGRIPEMKRFVVTDITDSGYDEYDKSVALIHLDDARKILGSGANSVTGLEVKLTEPLQANKVARDINSAIEAPFWTTSWIKMNRNIFSALKLQKSVMFIILVLIILVAAFNIAGSLFMMVMERVKDIAILMAMGATRKNIRRIFLLKGIVIGVIGNVLGVSLGFILCEVLKRYQFVELPDDVYYFTMLPVRVEGLDILIIVMAAFTICFFASLYPARLASRLVPVEGLREV
jgi:lipoprotein-releasing system permease protein